MKQIWFIRHGESESNAGAVTTDPHSTQLTPLGREQAKLTAQTFTEAPELIVTSPYIRTQQTAAPLRQRFPDTAHEEWQIYELGYIAPEKYAGTTGHDRIPWIRGFILNPDPDYRDGDEAESFRDMLGRVEVMRQQLIDSPAQSIAVYTHGAYLRVLWWQFLLGTGRAAERKEFFGPFLRAVSIPNCCIIHGRLLGSQLFLSEVKTDHLPPDMQS